MVSAKLKPGVSLSRIREDLPGEMPRLVEAAAGEGVRNVGKLVADFQSGAQRFDGAHAALFAAFGDGVLVGVGGMKLETGLGKTAIRMHRFYVHPDVRGRGVGRALAETVMAEALGQMRLLTCNAQASLGAPLFWQAMGFTPVAFDNITHIYRAP
jgi:GNAT superfamily N-acetyltransferase